jgi:hypothetical protein
MRKARQRRFTIGSIMDMAGQVIEDLTKSPEGMPTRIWAELSPWVTTFTTSAAAKFLPYLTEGKPCAVPALIAGTALPCTNHAISACEACGRAACVHHCMLDQHGSVVCYLCVMEVMRLKRGAIPPPAGYTADRQGPVAPDVARERVKRALSVLGLRDGASFEEIKRRHRKLCAEHHPDKHRAPEAKAEHEARYKQVSAAFMDLERFYKKSEAA